MPKRTRKEPAPPKAPIAAPKPQHEQIRKVQPLPIPRTATALEIFASIPAHPVWSSEPCECALCVSARAEGLV